MAHFDRLNLLTLAVLVFTAGAFLLPSEPAYSLVYYLAVIPAVLIPQKEEYSFLKKRTKRLLLNWRAPFSNARANEQKVFASFFKRKAFLCCLALIIWSGLTLVWGHDDKHRTWHFALDTICTLLFVQTLLQILPAREVRRCLGTVLIYCGTLNAVFSIVFGLVQYVGPRQHGWGISQNPILGAAVIAAPYLCALARAVTERPYRIAYLAACAAMGSFVLLTESRGPMLALAAATLVLCAAGPRPRLSAVIILGVAAVWLLLPASLHHHQAAVLLERGISYRPLIWRRTLQLIADRPIFGHGLAANLDIHGIPGVGDVTFPHDLYLSVLFYSGAIGLALFLALCAAVSLRLLRTRHPRDSDWLWATSLWLCGLINGITDLGQITKGPAEIWFIFWLPAALALTRVPTAEPQPTRNNRAPSLASQA